ncbi:MAG: hypothetical protein DI570_18895 [Phenylobacterium zucineum]|nr:MAG: hypothetical protein DI570_18895 [Phenylobacterium zucineum]
MTAQNAEQAWYDNEGYFNAEMERRIALSIGKSVMDRTATEIRLGMAQGRINDMGQALAEIEGEMAALRDLPSQLEAARAEAEDLGRQLIEAKKAAAPKPTRRT